MTSPSSDCSDTEQTLRPITIAGPVRVKWNPSWWPEDPAVAGVDTPPSRWGRERRLSYTFLPSEAPCCAPWHSQPQLPDGSGFHPFVPSENTLGFSEDHSRTEDDSPTADDSSTEDGSPAITLRERLSSLMRSDFNHDQDASAAGAPMAVQLKTKDKDGADGPSLLVLDKCSPSVVELFNALRKEEVRQQGHHLEGWMRASNDEEDLSCTPLSIHQLTLLYPDLMATLRKVTSAVFGTLKKNGTGSGSHFVRSPGVTEHTFPVSGWSVLREYEFWRDNVLHEVHSRAHPGESVMH